MLLLLLQDVILNHMNILFDSTHTVKITIHLLLLYLICYLTSYIAASFGLRALAG